MNGNYIMGLFGCLFVFASICYLGGLSLVSLFDFYSFFFTFVLFLSYLAMENGIRGALLLISLRAARIYENLRQIRDALFVATVMVSMLGLLAALNADKLKNSMGVVPLPVFYSMLAYYFVYKPFYTK